MAQGKVNLLDESKSNSAPTRALSRRRILTTSTGAAVALLSRPALASNGSAGQPSRPRALAGLEPRELFQQTAESATLSRAEDEVGHPLLHEIDRPRRVGTTFSQRQCGYLGLDPLETFAEVCTLDLDLVRLCCYWDEIEPQEGEFDFTTLDALLEIATEHRIPVILAVGMKAPRWPEFHFPEWVRNRFPVHETGQPLDTLPGLADLVFTFVRAVVAHAQHTPAVRYWQVENEPFHAMEITGHRYLSKDFVEQEAALVREMARPDQGIVVTNAINLWPPEGAPEDDAALDQSLAIADIIGINVYGKVPMESGDYLQPSPAFWTKLRAWRGLIEDDGKDAWIAELQAEPWERSPWEVVRDLSTTISASPSQTLTMAARATLFGYETCLLWGCEYWVYRRLAGDDSWWAAMKVFVDAS